MLADFFAQHSSTLLILLCTLLCIAAVMHPQIRRRWRQKQLLATPFPAHWRHILRQQWPIYRRLPTDLQLRLKKHIQLFLLEKKFVGCDGLEVNDEMRVLIAAQACLLTLKRPTPHYPDLSTILLYPQAFTVKTPQASQGIVNEQAHVRLGESWSHGEVVLSWPHSQAGAVDAEDGHNLVFHEFAHQLDQQTGQANGAPALPNAASYQAWSAHFSKAFEALRQQIAQQQPTFLDPYAATNPAEFFAVATETFFEKPHEFSQVYPAIYQLMREFYQLDPQYWQPTTSPQH